MLSRQKGDAGEPFAPEGVVWTTVSPRLVVLRRLLVTGPMLLLAAAGVAVPLLVGAATGAVLGALPLIALILIWWLVGRQVGAIGYAERAEDLLIRRGVMFRRIVVVPYGRMQYVDVHAGPVERLFGLARVQLHTASAGTDAWIPGLLPGEAARLRDRLASRGQARLAGL
ncbi:MAG: PH domain-containing protein [Kineosporiaceae bacterium]